MWLHRRVALSHPLVQVWLDPVSLRSATHVLHISDATVHKGHESISS
jgi:hypothetical protein